MTKLECDWCGVVIPPHQIMYPQEDDRSVIYGKASLSAYGLGAENLEVKVEGDFCHVCTALLKLRISNLMAKPVKEIPSIVEWIDVNEQLPSPINNDQTDSVLVYYPDSENPTEGSFDISYYYYNYPGENKPAWVDLESNINYEGPSHWAVLKRPGLTEESEL